jgi:hypothetical protein
LASQQQVSSPGLRSPNRWGRLVIVVVASSYDDRARKIAAHWGTQCAAILTAEDLCKPGWSFSIPDADHGTAVIGGKIFQSALISGILTLRPCVFPQELHNICSEDRPYVAAELTAFLLAWLAAQPCPVLNRPTAPCLAGPNWRPEQWIRAAAGLGIPVRARRRHIPNGGDGDAAANEEEAVEITVVGNRCFGCDDPALETRTLQLAREARVELLSVRFSRSGHRFMSANPWPALTSPSILGAAQERLESVG